MGKHISWFDMTSPKQRAKREKRYEQEMFPFGTEQREREIALLHKLIPGKHADSDLLYQLLQAKEAVGEADEEDRQRALSLWRGSELLRRLPKVTYESLLAMAQLEKEMTSLEEFPTEDRVLAHMTAKMRV